MNHIDSGVNAKEVFLSKIESAGVEVIQPDDSPCPMTASQPASNRTFSEAAMVSLLDYRAETGPVDLVWTIWMKNGDTLLLRQHINIYPVETRSYYADETPMETIEDLQALMTELEEASDDDAVINIYLPAVTYAGGLVMNNRAVNLYGSADGEARTTFTDPTRVTVGQGPIYNFYDIDFIGGSGVGISASAPLNMTECTVAGWHTALLAYGNK